MVMEGSQLALLHHQQQLSATVIVWLGHISELKSYYFVAYTV